MSTVTTSAWEIFVEKIAEVLAYSLDTKETELIINSVNSFSSKVRELSSNNLKSLEQLARERPFCRHKGRCRQNCMRGFIHSFTAAYGVKYAVAVIQGLFNGKLRRSYQFLFYNPSVIDVDDVDVDD